LPAVQIEDFIVNDDIEVDINIVIDGSESNNIGQAKRDVEQILREQGFDVSTEVAIVTPAPSVSPTFTTLMPSPAPSITGLVVTLTLSTSDEIIDSAGVSSLAQQLAADYGVDVEDVTIEPTYSVSGSIEINDVSRDISDEEFEQILKDSIADALDVHSRDVKIAIDKNTREVTYVVSSNDEEVASNIQETIRSSSFLNDLNDEISSVLPSTAISSIDADDEIEVELIVTIDASESTTDVEEVNAEVVSSMEDRGFFAESETVLVTPRPTSHPVISPTSDVPSAIPSMTGMIATFEITSTVTSSLTQAELDAIESEITSGFDISDEEIGTTVTYETTGTMFVDGSDLTDDEIVSALKSALANELDVHPSDIVMMYDSDTEVVTYTITSDDAESLVDIVNEIQQDGFEIIPEGVAVKTITPPTDITVNIDVTVDASNVMDADTLVDSVVENLQTQDPSFVVEGAIQFITSAPSKDPTVKPTRAPLTSVPSPVPSISGWVATISASTAATGPISTNEIQSYTENVAEFYGVDESNVEVVTTYETTGSM
jgi:hypothetical protein